ncbi:hypothetical protein ISS30_02675 [bacterium]|nr:hypothetical protein [FCB group bacterium]MBL7190574.1 hypothetical protein [bacterium]
MNYWNNPVFTRPYASGRIGGAVNVDSLCLFACIARILFDALNQAGGGSFNKDL